MENRRSTVFSFALRLLQGFSTHEVSFNMDYFPAATLLHGPVWKNPVQLLPVAKVLEDNYLMIRSELEGILNYVLL